MLGASVWAPMKSSFRSIELADVVGSEVGHHANAQARRPGGPVKPASPEGVGAKRRGLTGPRDARESRLVMAPRYVMRDLRRCSVAGRRRLRRSCNSGR